MNLLYEQRGYRGEHMSLVSMQHIPLANAYLCQDCSSVGNNSMHCPACASEALMGLAGVLNRKAEERAQVGLARVPALAA